MHPLPFSCHVGAADVRAQRNRSNRVGSRLAKGTAAHRSLRMGWRCRPACPARQGRSGQSGYCTVTFLDAVLAFFGSSSVSTPSAYLATALASSTSWDRLKVRDTLP